MKKKVQHDIDNEESVSSPNDNMDLLKGSKISALIEDTYTSLEIYEVAYQPGSSDRNHFDY